MRPQDKTVEEIFGSPLKSAYSSLPTKDVTGFKEILKDDPNAVQTVGKILHNLHFNNQSMSLSEMIGDINDLIETLQKKDISDV